MATTTDTAPQVCGDPATTAIGDFTCVLPPHDDDLHFNGVGTYWRNLPDTDPLDGLPHLLWSNRYHQWWRPNRAGYTSDVWQAGRYSRTDAVFEARVDDHENPPAIVAVLAPEAGRDAFTPAELAGVGEMMRQRTAAATAAVIDARGGAE
ncbi:hypothetical protein GCM10010399_63650 [Dactylosporangium fulvum]|uniref:Uncharacterized protein n=1 Tax=Dactylosporangium fulvum TaxID=53359 RepID=A0ABY5W8C9_9ACTN|nr:hypothetical protein [Dactylosporangium fulvum]UWP85812.1 hypothetical protein Dfulv_16830 [Dactylosporangium fulvum]